ncbi:MAG: hypothetical protein J6Y36_08945 [Treponema sp.]|uniref:hypothetical protein n=1 Tax=Treponema sp. TaxID=166 RepID=UPI001B3D6EF9|nr:hypothetical protein [Treponema sp.]MBP5403269.1 hypothetical protein [Treponema sp.]MBR5932686.1 hypothetical protein [Treponema sp.]
MNFNKNRFSVLFAFIPLLFFTGCPLNVSIHNDTGDKVLFSIDTTAGNEIKSVFAPKDKSGNQKESILFDSIEIEKALIQSGFTTAKAFVTKKDQNESLSVYASTLKTTFDFIKFNSAADGSIKSVSVTLSPEILQNLITNQNTIIQKYADLLMAPCFTGENLSKEEYFDVLASFYGENLAKELSNGYFTLSLVKKTAVQSSIKIPVMEILTLQSEKTYTFSAE